VCICVCVCVFMSMYVCMQAHVLSLQGSHELVSHTVQRLGPHLYNVLAREGLHPAWLALGSSVPVSKCPSVIPAPGVHLLCDLLFVVEDSQEHFNTSDTVLEHRY